MIDLKSEVTAIGEATIRVGGEIDIAVAHIKGAAENRQLSFHHPRAKSRRRLAGSFWRRAGEILCYLAGTKTWKAPKTNKKTIGTKIPEGLRITQPALILAQKLAQAMGHPFGAKSLEEVELMESILEQQYDNRKFFIEDIGKNEYWSVKEK